MWVAASLPPLSVVCQRLLQVHLSLCRPATQKSQRTIAECLMRGGWLCTRQRKMM